MIRAAASRRRAGTAGLAGLLLSLLLAGCAQPAGDAEASDPAPHSTFTAPTAEQIEASRKDRSEIYESDCYAGYESSDPGSDCVLTEPEPEADADADTVFSVALVGDSHAAQWVPALLPIAEANGWRLTFHGKRACSFSVNEHNDNRGDRYWSCDEWNAALGERLLAERPDAVIVSNYGRTVVMHGDEMLDREAGGSGEAAIADGMVQAIGPLLDAGIAVAIMRDTPFPGFSSPDCLLEHLDDTEACGLSYDEAVTAQAHPEELAAQRLPGSRLLDLNRTICRDGSDCLSYDGDAVVWRDKHHLTASFAAKLQPELQRQLSEIPPFADHL